MQMITAFLTQAHSRPPCLQVSFDRIPSASALHPLLQFTLSPSPICITFRTMPSQPRSESPSTIQPCFLGSRLGFSVDQGYTTRGDPSWQHVISGTSIRHAGSVSSAAYKPMNPEVPTGNRLPWMWLSGPMGKINLDVSVSEEGLLSAFCPKCASYIHLSPVRCSSFPLLPYLPVSSGLFDYHAPVPLPTTSSHALLLLGLQLFSSLVYS